MNEKELKLDWVEDEEGDFMAIRGKFKLVTELYRYSGVTGKVIWDGCTHWYRQGYESHKAAQLAAEQAARELGEQFDALREVLGEEE
jgi:hypothetical protein